MIPATRRFLVTRATTTATRARPALLVHTGSSSQYRRLYCTTAATSEIQEELTELPYFPDEPLRPSIRTHVPGPASKAVVKRLGQYQDTRSVFFVAGIDRCFIKEKPD